MLRRISSKDSSWGELLPHIIVHLFFFLEQPLPACPPARQPASPKGHFSQVVIIMLWKPLRGSVENATGPNERSAHQWEICQGGMGGAKGREGEAILFIIYLFIWGLLVFPGDGSIAESHLGSFGGLSKTQTSKINLFFFVLAPHPLLILLLFSHAFP